MNKFVILKLLSAIALTFADQQQQTAEVVKCRLRPVSGTPCPFSTVALTVSSCTDSSLLTTVIQTPQSSDSSTTASITAETTPCTTVASTTIKPPAVQTSSDCSTTSTDVINSISASTRIYSSNTSATKQVNTLSTPGTSSSRASSTTVLTSTIVSSKQSSTKILTTTATTSTIYTTTTQTPGIPPVTPPPPVIPPAPTSTPPVKPPTATPPPVKPPAPTPTPPPAKPPAPTPTPTPPPTKPPAPTPTPTPPPAIPPAPTPTSPVKPPTATPPPVKPPTPISTPPPPTPSPPSLPPPSRRPSSQGYCPNRPNKRCSPLVFDLNNDGVVSAKRGVGISFNHEDIDQHVGAATDGDKMLAMSDTNQNGVIDSQEVFGDRTISPLTKKPYQARNGFEALKMLVSELSPICGNLYIDMIGTYVDTDKLRECLKQIGSDLGFISDSNVRVLEDLGDVQAINVADYIDTPEDNQDGIGHYQKSDFLDRLGRKRKVDDVWFRKR
ncbi:hypothetical protein MIR68_003890 [Amoeboaphelidium protococcarum]|nr:hypothetical protein MIR68_003890 [Amoeboaphelidium protococcarum]